MDREVVAWARAVKSREAQAGRRSIPPLWLFTDPSRMPDLHAAIAALPRSLCGVVFRHDQAPDRAALAVAIARQCRALRIPLVIAGDWRLAARCRAGQHLRNGWVENFHTRSLRLATSSAHDRSSCRRARRARVDAIFFSPAFPTVSHPGAPAWGPVRWAAIATTLGPATPPVLALGGIAAHLPHRLPRCCAGAGAIGALTHIVASAPQCFGIAMP